MRQYCYLNGKIVPLKEAKISPADLGILRGYSVFDVMRTEKGRAFLVDKHWKHFQNSAKKLRLKIPISLENYKRVIAKLVGINGFKESAIRTVLSGGISSDKFSLENGKETFYILVDEFHKLPEAAYKRGAKVITVEYSRESASAKATNYIKAIQNQGRKKAAGALEIVYIKNRTALEASTSNLFIVKKGEIITAKEEVLHGVTRNLVLKLARKAGFSVQERRIKSQELFSADEIFLTATIKGIVPVVKVDKKKVGDGKVGKATKKLMASFYDFVKKY